MRGHMNVKNYHFAKPAVIFEIPTTPISEEYLKKNIDK